MKRVELRTVVLYMCLALLLMPSILTLSAVLAETRKEINAEGTGQTKALQEAIRLHSVATKGKKGVAKKANQLLNKIVKREPKNALAAAYFGSTYALMARDADSVVNKIRYSNRGVRYLDEALGLAPEDFIVRFIRAKVNSSLPSMFHRSKKATQDMLVLDRLYQLKPLKYRAAMMIDIYEQLLTRAPKKGPWAERIRQVRAARDKD